MTITGILCPIDGLVLAPAANAALLESQIRDKAEGKHVHVRISGTLACVDNHKWIVGGEFELSRTR
jgi:hypothetical protein